jgi:hypothetical protein
MYSSTSGFKLPTVIVSGPARTYGSTTTSALLVAGALGSLVVQLFVVPLVLLPRDASWGWLLVPFVLTGTPLWSILHESIHGTLLRDRSWNDRLGRALAIGYGAPFVLLKSGHLLHHRFSRSPRERTEVYDSAQASWAGRAPLYYLRLIGGLYLAEVATVLLAVASRSMWRRLGMWLDAPDTVAGLLFDSVSRRRLGQFRSDAGLILVSYTTAFIAYGKAPGC